MTIPKWVYWVGWAVTSIGAFFVGILISRKGISNETNTVVLPSASDILHDPDVVGEIDSGRDRSRNKLRGLVRRLRSKDSSASDGENVRGGD